MAENHENPCFTFFAFLPPYFGVSGSLVLGMRKSVTRSIDWYQKFLISRPAARYSAVFVFLSCARVLCAGLVRFSCAPKANYSTKHRKATAHETAREPFLCTMLVVRLYYCIQTHFCSSLLTFSVVLPFVLSKSRPSLHGIFVDRAIG